MQPNQVFLSELVIEWRFPKKVSSVAKCRDALLNDAGAVWNPSISFILKDHVNRNWQKNKLLHDLSQLFDVGFSNTH